MAEQPFDEALAAVTSSLGDPTRRAIFLLVRTADESQTVAAIAERFGIHPNVARYHLDHLVDTGYLRMDRAQPGRGAGRPAHRYEPTDHEIHIDLPEQSFELLARLLIRVLLRVSTVDAAELAYEVGVAHGEELARTEGLPRDASLAETVDGIVGIMGRMGFSITADPTVHADSTQCRYETGHCPFGTLALDNPRVVCALDRGLVTGLVRAWDRRAEVEVMPHRTMAEGCAALITSGRR